MTSFWFVCGALSYFPSSSWSPPFNEPCHAYCCKKLLDQGTNGVFLCNPTAKVYMGQSLNAAHKSSQMNKEKMRNYTKRINLVNQGPFTPLIFTCFGGMVRECTVFYNRLADAIAEKRREQSNKVKCWLRTRISYDRNCSASEDRAPSETPRTTTLRKQTSRSPLRNAKYVSHC